MSSIQIEKVEFSRFGSFGDKPTVLDFKKLNDITMILGDNRDDARSDSNGSGKSYLTEPVTFSFFGDVLRKGEYVTDIIHNNKGTCFVKNTFKAKGKRYTIERSRGTSRGSNFVKLITPNLTITGKPAQSRINRLVGHSPTSFNVRVYPTSAPVSMVDLTSSERFKLLNDVFTFLKEYERGRKNAMVKEQMYKEKIKVLGVKIKSIKKLMSEQEDQLVYLDGKIAEYEKERKIEIKYCNDIIKKKKAHIKHLREAQIKREKHLKHKKQSIVANIKVNEKSIKNITEKIEEMEARIKENKGVDKEHAILMNNYNRLTDELKDLPKIGKCPTCKRKVTKKSRDRTKKELEEKILAIREEIKGMTIKVEDYEHDKKVSASQRDFILHLKQNIVDINQEVKIIDNELKTGENAEIVSLKTEIKEYKKRKARAKESECPYLEMREGVEQKIVKAKSKKKKYISKRKKLKERLSYASFWVNGMVRARELAIEKLLNKFEILANSYMSELSNIIKITIKPFGKTKKDKKTNKFSIIVDDGYKRVPVGMWSSGEKRKVRVSVSLALADLISMYTSKSINVMFLDEATYGLDEKGTRQIYNLVNKRIDKFKQKVLFIDHSSEFKDLFQHKLWVRKKGGVSKLIEGGGINVRKKLKRRK